MLGGKLTVLSTDTVIQTLTAPTAAGKAAQGTHGGLTNAGADRVNRFRIQKNQDPVTLVFFKDILPKEGPGNDDGTAGEQKPKKTDTAGKSHTKENKYEDQGNARVTGNNKIRTDQ